MYDIESLRVQLALLDDRLVQWSNADDALFQERLAAGVALEQIVNDISADRQSRVEDGVADPRRELFELLDDLADAYLDADNAERGAIRGAFNGKDRVMAALDNYVSRAADQIRSGDDIQWLRRGLAAASMLDVRLDPQDTRVGLGNLYRAATTADIDPEPVFKDVAALSSDAYPGRFGSARALLESFRESDYFRETVEPEL